MSSSIPSPPRRIATRVVLPIIVVATAVGVLAWSSWRAWAPLTHVRAVPVVLRPVALSAAGDGDGAKQASSGAAAQGRAVMAPGWIEPAPFPIVAPALTPSVVREVLVLEGDTVAKDQVVARLVDDEEKLALRRTKADVAIKASELAALQDELTRKTKLVNSGTVSEGEAARLALKVDGAMAALDLAKATQDEAALALSRTEVRSPADGVVMARLAAPGMVVGTDAANSTVVLLFDPKQLQVRTDVPLSEAGRLAVGQPAEVLVDALPGKVMRGRVLRLVQQADIAKNTVQAKVLLEDAPAGLVPDMLARVKIFTESTVQRPGTTPGGDRSEVAAPESALGGLPDDGSGTRSGVIRVVVDVRDGVGRIEERTIECDRAGADGWTTVMTGLRPGDLVVLADSPPTKAGEMVRVDGNPAGAQAEGAHDGHK